MTHISDTLLEKWAKKATNNYFEKNIPLNDSVTDTAKEEQLQPEQIKRLVESVNTETFLRKFNDMGKLDPKAKDRMVEFETASADSVISRMLNKAKSVLDSVKSTPVATLSGDDDDNDLSCALPNTRDNADNEDSGVHLLSALSPEKDTGPKINKTIILLRLRKTASYLRDQALQSRMHFTQATQDMADKLSRLGADFDTFEKDAFHVHGEEAAPHLQMLRKILRKPRAEYDVAESQKTARYVDASTKEMELLRDMLHWTQEHKTAEAAVKKTEEYLAQLTA